MNFEGFIPAVLLLALHFWLKISFWWAVLAAALWVVGIILHTLLIGWSAGCAGTPDKPKENKNPYSAGK